MNERVALGGGDAAAGLGADQRGARRVAGQPPSPRRGDARPVVKLWIQAEVLRLTNARARATAKAGTPGPEGSIGKLLSAELNKRIGECASTCSAPAACCTPPATRWRVRARGARRRTTRALFLRMRAQSIEGGTSEVMRNILGERVLGLPKEPAVDRDLPWSQVPRNV